MRLVLIAVVWVTFFALIHSSDFLQTVAVETIAQIVQRSVSTGVVIIPPGILDRHSLSTNEHRTLLWKRKC